MSSPLACLVAMRHRLMWWEPFFFCSDSGPSSSSFCRLYFVLRFWNHTFTWAGEGGAQVRNSRRDLSTQNELGADGETEARVLFSGQLPPRVWRGRSGQKGAGGGAAEHPTVATAHREEGGRPGSGAQQTWVSMVPREETTITLPQG